MLADNNNNTTMATPGGPATPAAPALQQPVLGHAPNYPAANSTPRMTPAAGLPVPSPRGLFPLEAQGEDGRPDDTRQVPSQAPEDAAGRAVAAPGTGGEGAALTSSQKIELALEPLRKPRGRPRGSLNRKTIQRLEAHAQAQRQAALGLPTLPGYDVTRGPPPPSGSTPPAVPTPTFQFAAAAQAASQLMQADNTARAPKRRLEEEAASSGVVPSTAPAPVVPQSAPAFDLQGSQPLAIGQLLSQVALPREATLADAARNFGSLSSAVQQILNAEMLQPPLAAGQTLPVASQHAGGPGAAAHLSQLVLGVPVPSQEAVNPPFSSAEAPPKRRRGRPPKPKPEGALSPPGSSPEAGALPSSGPPPVSSLAHVPDAFIKGLQDAALSEIRMAYAQDLAANPGQTPTEIGSAAEQLAVCLRALVQEEVARAAAIAVPAVCLALQLKPKALRDLDPSARPLGRPKGSRTRPSTAAQVATATPASGGLMTTSAPQPGVLEAAGAAQVEGAAALSTLPGAAQGYDPEEGASGEAPQDLTGSGVQYGAQHLGEGQAFPAPTSLPEAESGSPAGMATPEDMLHMP